MKKQHVLKNEQGFTLIEIIAVLVILGILAAVAVPKYLDLADNAKARAIDAGIAELNSRENLNWANVKLDAAGYVAASDAAIKTAVVGATLGSDYTLTATDTGGSLTFQSGTAVTLTRTASETDHPGRWARSSS